MLDHPVPDPAVPLGPPLVAASPNRDDLRVRPLDLAALEGTPPLVAAGLAGLLAPYSARVRVVRPGRPADVLVADLSHRPGPLRVPVTISPLVVLVRDGDADAVAQARAGGADPVTIAATADLLVRTVQTAFRRHGQRPAPAGRPALAPMGPSIPLSPREVEVVEAICAGHSNAEIAAQLFLSINSVKTYIRSAYRKMGVQRRGQAVVWGMQRGYGARRPAGG